MAVSFLKTYSLELKYSYEDARAILATDMNVEVLRTKIQKLILEAVGHINMGDLSVHATGAVSEA